MFDVIALSILSTTFNTLLYLNRPPNLFTSPDFEYVVSADIIFDVTASTHRVRVRSVGATATVKGAQTSEAASTFLIFDQIG